jgi:hypothetical protein
LPWRGRNEVRAGRGAVNILARRNIGIAVLQGVPMDQVMITAFKDLQESIEANGAIVKVDELPEVHGDFQQMVQLMENLIANAIKFRKEEPPSVHVSAAMVGNEWIFSVKDNGIGIAKEYSDKVFQMFQRLHPRETFPGTAFAWRYARRSWNATAAGYGSSQNPEMAQSSSSLCRLRRRERDLLSEQSGRIKNASAGQEHFYCHPHCF